MTMLSTLIGGIGLFLLGMILLTEGLKSAAGHALRGVLERLTGGPLKAFFSGAVVAAVVQSSSATMLSTIGFVSAGLLSFPQGVGVILGANVGTTSTGWLVAVLGLRMNIGALALPFIGVGALMRLLSSGRRAHLGIALAGFGLIFVGVDTLQAGMAELAQRMDPGRFQARDLGGRLVLVLVGMVMTVVMQSSSAAVAATLTALHAGALRMEDAAVLVIGQNVGTTVKAALAAVGASTPARRTAVAHIVFNVLTAAIAFLFLPLFLQFARLVAVLVPGDADATGIAAFHTAFNILGVAVFLPFVTPFSRMIVRLVPERGPELTRYLDASVASVAPVAVESARLTCVRVALLLVQAVDQLLDRSRPPRGLEEVSQRAMDALARTRSFLRGVRSGDDTGPDRDRHLSVLHAVDHLESLANAIADENHDFAGVVWAELGDTADELREGLRTFAEWAEHQALEAPVKKLAALSERIAGLRRSRRPLVMEQTASGDLDPDEGLAHLDAIRRVDRIGYHIWRAAHHLWLASRGVSVPPGPGNVEVEGWTDVPDRFAES